MTIRPELASGRLPTIKRVREKRLWRLNLDVINAIMCS